MLSQATYQCETGATQHIGKHRKTRKKTWQWNPEKLRRLHKDDVTYAHTHTCTWFQPLWWRQAARGAIPWNPSYRTLPKYLPTLQACGWCSGESWRGRELNILVIEVWIMWQCDRHRRCQMFVGEAWTIWQWDWYRRAQVISKVFDCHDFLLQSEFQIWKWYKRVVDWKFWVGPQR